MSCLDLEIKTKYTYIETEECEDCQVKLELNLQCEDCKEFKDNNEVKFYIRGNTGSFCKIS